MKLTMISLPLEEIRYSSSDLFPYPYRMSSFYFY